MTEAMDAAMMARCIELSKTCKQEGEFPFACVIAKDGKVIVETLNRVARLEPADLGCDPLSRLFRSAAQGRAGHAGCTAPPQHSPEAIRAARLSSRV